VPVWPSDVESLRHERHEKKSSQASQGKSLYILRLIRPAMRPSIYVNEQIPYRKGRNGGILIPSSGEGKKTAGVINSGGHGSPQT